MTTKPVHSITDDQIAEIEALASNASKSTGDLYLYANSMTPSLLFAITTRLREAEKDAARYKSALIEIANEIDGNIRPTVRDCVNGRPDVQDIYYYCDCIDKTIYAAMQGEQ